MFRHTASFLLLAVGFIAVSQAFAVISPTTTVRSITKNNNNHYRPAPTTKTTTLSSSSSTSSTLSSVVALKSMPNGGATIVSPPSPPPPASLIVQDLKGPVPLYDGAVAAGTVKATSSAMKIFQLGIVAGMHIGLGSFLAISIGGNCPGLATTNPGLQKLILGGMGLPTGLLMTLVTGAELFTGNTALVTAAYMEKKIQFKDLMKNWFWSFTGNFIGSLLIAYIAFGANTLGGAAPGAVNIALAKVSAPWLATFYRGVLCNFFVCMAVYMASGCSTMIGKMTAIWFPISAFVALGLDHSVANMFIIPFGMFRGADISIVQLFTKNLIPVTLGNIVGGAIMVMMPFGTTIGKWGSRITSSSSSTSSTIGTKKKNT